MGVRKMEPVISGVLGSIIAAVICGWWISKYPFKISKQKQKDLIYRYSLSIKASNIFLLFPLLAGIILFKFGVIASDDWRFGFLMLGSAFGLPMLAALIPPKHGIRSFNEAINAIAIKQHAPVALLLFIMVFGLSLAAIGLLNLAA